MNEISIIKIGGNVLDDAGTLKVFLQEFALIEGNKMLIHGGGKRATSLAKTLGIEQKMVEGRRITDEETLRIVTMVYAGEINKNLVAELQANHCKAIGLSGADGNLIRSGKRGAGEIDYGFAGDVEEVNAELIQNLFGIGLVPVIAPITHNGMGQLLNTNADTITNKLAIALTPFYRVRLIYIFEKKGVLLNADDENSLITEMNFDLFQKLKKEGKIFAGMIPKLENAFDAIHSGVDEVLIGKAENLSQLLNLKGGTRII